MCLISKGVIADFPFLILVFVQSSSKNNFTRVDAAISNLFPKYLKYVANIDVLQTPS